MAEQQNQGIVIPVNIELITNGGTGGGGGESVTETQADNSTPEDKKKAASASKSNANAAKAMVKQMVGKVANTALNNYGAITGDYTTQANIQTLVGEGTALASAIALGPAGIATYVVDKGLQLYSYVSQLKQSEQKSKFAKERVYASDD